MNCIEEVEEYDDF